MEYLCKNITVVPKINQINIRNKGIIKNADIKFKDGLNIICCKNATGKTTVLNEIKKKNGAIEVNALIKGLSAQNQILLLLFGLEEVVSNKCILLDDIIARMTDSSIAEVLKKLEKSKNQIIMTSIDHRVKKFNKKIKANYINTANFQLK